MLRDKNNKIPSNFFFIIEENKQQIKGKRRFLCITNFRQNIDFFILL